jgi:hypothetical protein
MFNDGDLSRLVVIEIATIATKTAAVKHATNMMRNKEGA